MCTAATYKTKDFYFGRTLDYEFSYGDQIVITPRNYAFNFRHVGDMKNHYAIIGMAHVAEDYPMRRKTPCFSYGDIRRVHRIYASN